MFFAGNRGATAFRPGTVSDNSVVPPVVLTDFQLFREPVAVGAKNSPLTKGIAYTNKIELKHDQDMVTFEFSALSFTAPMANRYRFRLEGFESRWNETSGKLRRATYTTLPPGNYIFRVQGSNNRGVWNEPGITLEFSVLPAYWQTNWFRLACVAAFLFMIWGIHELRVRQLAAQFNMRLEERVAERTRIARDVHDTLLQSFQGLVFRFQAVRNQLPNRPEKACEVLDSALTSADQAIAEGRGAIQQLRSGSSEESNLEQMLLAVGRELAASQNGGDSAPPLRVIVEGNRRAKRAMIREEVYRIAREFLRNAYRHARARNIEAELRYDDDAFLLIVRDDGKGIDPEVLKDHGRTGHWGLPGMYERAEGMGARLDIWSEVGAGTEVRLKVPAANAYERSGDRGRFQLFRKTRIYEHRS
jgi:signal transduction histidine kinase